MIAGKLGNEVSPRAIQNWVNGSVPSLRHRVLLETRLAVPASSWAQPPSPFERELAGQLAASIAGALRARAEVLRPSLSSPGEAL